MACYMLLGYSFELRSKSCALDTAGSVMIISFINKWMLTLEKTSLTRGNKVD